MEDVHNIGKDVYRPANPIKRTVMQEIMGVCDIIIRVFIYGTFVTIVDLIYKRFSGKLSAKDIKGQLALVTGGANGVGKLIAIELAKYGCNIAIIDLDKRATDQTVELVSSLGVKCKGYQVDVSSYQAVEDISKTIENDIGPVDILINNAGIMPAYSLHEGTPEDIQRILNINLASHFWTVRTFMPGMVDRRRGHIVAMCSVAGLASICKSVGYTTSKFGLRGFMDALQDDLIYESKDHIIRLTTVFPVFMNTRYDLMEYVRETMGADGYVPIVDAELVAKETVQGILYNKRYIVIPKIFFVVSAFLSTIPSAFSDTYKKLILHRT